MNTDNTDWRDKRGYFFCGKLTLQEYDLFPDLTVCKTDNCEGNCDNLFMKLSPQPVILYPLFRYIATHPAPLVLKIIKTKNNETGDSKKIKREQEEGNGLVCQTKRLGYYRIYKSQER